MKHSKRKQPPLVKKVNSHRLRLGLSWSELADRYTIDREWMRGFLLGRKKMHVAFAASLSEDAGGDISVWLGRN